MSHPGVVWRIIIYKKNYITGVQIMRKDLLMGLTDEQMNKRVLL